MGQASVEKPLLGGSVMPRRTAVTLVVLALLPPVAWLISLAGSYALDDFVCAAAHSAGVAAPSSGVLVGVIVLNAVLFLATVSAGVFAFRIGRANRHEHPVMKFLGVTTLPSAIIFAHGIVLITLFGIAFGGCS